MKYASLVPLLHTDLERAVIEHAETCVLEVFGITMGLDGEFSCPCGWSYRAHI